MDSQGRGPRSFDHPLLGHRPYRIGARPNALNTLFANVRQPPKSLEQPVEALLARGIEPAQKHRFLHRITETEQQTSQAVSAAAVGNVVGDVDRSDMWSGRKRSCRWQMVVLRIRFQFRLEDIQYPSNALSGAGFKTATTALHHFRKRLPHSSAVPRFALNTHQGASGGRKGCLSGRNTALLALNTHQGASGGRKSSRRSYGNLDSRSAHERRLGLAGRDTPYRSLHGLERLCPLRDLRSSSSRGNAILRHSWKTKPQESLTQRAVDSEPERVPLADLPAPTLENRRCRFVA